MTSPSPDPAACWLSVAMPVHNGGRWLGETLASAAAQDCSGIEFLLLDSSEDDACQRIAEAFQARLNIRYQRRTDLKPWTAKTNLAAREARAPHFTMLHQDDLWLPGRVDDVRAAIAAHPEAALLLNPSRIIDQHSRPLGLWRCPLPADVALPAARLAERLLVQNFVAIPAPVVRRDAWLAAGGMDESLWYTADWDLYLKVAQQGPTVYRRKATTAFRVHSGSLTVTGSASRSDFDQQMIAVVERHSGLLPASIRAKTIRRAMASIGVNHALAGALAGSSAGLMKALATVIGLGPLEATRYLHESRLFERLLPRLRASMRASV